MKYKSVEATNVIQFEGKEHVCSYKELFKRHLLLSVVLQCARHDWQQVLLQASTDASG